MFLMLLYLLLPLYPIVSNAANDWSKACAGSCAYESGDGINTAWGSILLVCVTLSTSLFTMLKARNL